MSFNFFNYVGHDEDYRRPMLAFDWFYFNGTPEVLEKRNAYRTRVGFKKIIDAGCYFRFEIQIRERTLGFHIDFRHFKTET